MHFDIDIFGLTEYHRSLLAMILGEAEDKRPELSEPERQARGRVFGTPGVSLRSIPTGYSAPRAGQDMSK